MLKAERPGQYAFEKKFQKPSFSNEKGKDLNRACY